MNTLNFIFMKTTSLKMAVIAMTLVMTTSLSKKSKFIFSLITCIIISTSTVFAQYSDLYLLGSATPVGWDIGNPSKFKKDASNSNLFTWEGTLTPGELKIPTYKGDWGGIFIVANVAGHDLTTTNYIESSSIDNKWNVSTEGIYRITVDLTAKTVSFQSITAFSNLYLVGSSTRYGWIIGNPVPMIKDASNPSIFTWEGTLKSGEFKISTFTGDWSHGDYIMPPSNGTSLVTTNYILSRNNTDNRWSLGANGKYRITVNMNNGTVSFTPITYYSKLFILGSATTAGWNPTAPLSMTQSASDPTVFIYQGHLNTGNFRIHTYIGDWEQSDMIIAAGSDNTPISNDGSTLSYGISDGISISNAWTWYVTEGDYLITLNQTAQTIDIRKRYVLSGNGNLGSNSNWSSGTIPANGALITVSSGEFTVDNDINLANVTVNSGAKLTVNQGKSLNVGTLTLESGVNGTATVVDAGTLATTTANVKQYLTSGRNWYVSSPVTGASASVLNTGTSVVYYNEPEARWDTETSSLQVGKGYITVNTASTGTVSFSGTLNSGEKTVALTRTAGKAKEGFNLIGNPFPSYLNAMTAINGQTNIEKTIWYRTRNGSNSYVFDAVNTTTGVGTNNNGSGDVTGIIPPLQAFWVRVATGNSSASLTFDNSMRSHESGTNRLKVPVSKSLEQKVLRLQVSNGINSDEAIILFNPNASNVFDDYDSPKMTNANVVIPEIYTMAGTEQVVINGLNSIPYDTEIPLGFTTGQTNTFTIRATQFNNFETATKIILRDKQLNIERNLTLDDYAFTSDSIATIGRFAIIFKATSETTGFDLTGNNLIWVSINANSQLVINGDIKGESIVTVYNAVGQKLVENELSENSKVIQKPLQAGVYLITVNNAGKTINQKVIIK